MPFARRQGAIATSSTLDTRAHQERLRQIITDLDGSPTDSKADLPTLRLPTGMQAKRP